MMREPIEHGGRHLGIGETCGQSEKARLVVMKV
jgi:hypothetical protein